MQLININSTCININLTPGDLTCKKKKIAMLCNETLRSCLMSEGPQMFLIRTCKKKIKISLSCSLGRCFEKKKRRRTQKVTSVEDRLIKFL